MIIFLRLLQGLFRLIFKLPAAWAILIMRGAAEIIFQIVRLTKIRKVAARNIRQVFPAADGEKLADSLLKNTSHFAFEVLCTPFFEISHVDLICRMIGLEKIDLALAERKGLILLTMHTGNYELIPTFLATHGYHVASILKAPMDDPLFKFLNPSRSHKGIRLINVLEGNMYRDALQALDRNRCLCIAADTGALESRHEMLPFLGKMLPVATGWIALAQRSGSPVLPILSRREGNQLIMTVGDPIIIKRDNREEVIQKASNYFEAFIKKYPDQWGIFINEYETKRMVEGK